VRAFVGYYPMNTSSCRVMKSYRYDTEEESFYCFKALRKVRVVAGGFILEADLTSGDAGGPQTWSYFS
jgi:hypothetical protein